MFKYAALCFSIFSSLSSHAIFNGKNPSWLMPLPSTTHLSIAVDGADIKTIRDQREGVWNCSGVFISQDLLLTAGHCIIDFVRPNENPLAAPINIESPTKILSLPNGRVATAWYTEFDANDDLAVSNKPQDSKAVPGCSSQQRPLTTSPHLDLALIRFAPTSARQAISNIETNFKPQIKESLVYAGAGSTSHPFVDNLGSLGSSIDGKIMFNKQKIWRISDQRFAFKTKDLPQASFASVGDSGGPVFSHGKLVGILNTVEANCETPMGLDYGIVNTATLLSTPQAQAFLARARKYFETK